MKRGPEPCFYDGHTMFAIRIPHNPNTVRTSREDSDQTVLIRKLCWVIAVNTYSKVHFHATPIKHNIIYSKRLYLINFYELKFTRNKSKF